MGPPSQTRRPCGSLRLAAAAVLAAASIAAALPPLDDETLAALAAASDGLDRRDEAWHRLLEDARGWPSDPAELREALDAAPIVRRPAWGEWLVEPDPHRGKLVRLRGRLEQETLFEWPAARGGEPSPRLAEWFIRLDAASGEEQSPPTVQCWVVDPPPSEAGRGPRQVEVAGRFLRVTEERSRDGVSRRWHTFVGVEVVAEPRPASSGAAWVVGALVVAMLPLLLWLRRLSRAGRGGMAARLDRGEDSPMPARSDLPEDPAEALAVLREEASATDAEDGGR